MLIQSSHSNSLTTELSLASNFIKHNAELLYDCSYRDGSWQASPDSEHDKKTSFTGEDGNKVSCSEVVEISRTNDDVSLIDDTCATAGSKWNGIVYKRRKIQRNNVIIVDCQEVNISLCRQSFDFNPSNSRQFSAHDPTVALCLASEGNNLLSKSSKCDRHLDREIILALPAESLGSFSHINDRCSSSKPNTGEADVPIHELLGGFTEAREFCISVLKKQGGLAGRSTRSVNNTSKIPGTNNGNLSISCQVCSIQGNPLKMLICDLCEEAFHVSCCTPKVKDFLVKDWYCQPCFRKRPKPLRERTSRKKTNILCGLQKSLGTEWVISCMLRDDQPYTAGVRIGKDFQAEVPEWGGTISEDINYFDAQLLVDPGEHAFLKNQNVEKLSKPCSYSNWIQCRQITYRSSKDKGSVCGKWRRAPLFVAQTSDWDCSCSVLWDPIHADCSVPQELETNVILKQIQYVDMLRPRMISSQQRFSENKNDVTDVLAGTKKILSIIPGDER